MNVPPTVAGLRVLVVSAYVLTTLTGCASSGSRSSAASADRGGDDAVLTGAEISAAQVITNAYDAIQTLRPQFLRTRGRVSPPAGLLGTGGSRTPTGRPTQAPGNPPAGPGAPSSGETAGATPAMEAPEIVVYLDQQRYGLLPSLREIPVAMVEEIRFLNAADANTRFGMGHPHGVIHVIRKKPAGSA